MLSGLIEQPRQIVVGQDFQVPPVGGRRVEFAGFAAEKQTFAHVPNGGRILFHAGNENDLPAGSVADVRPYSHPGGLSHVHLWVRGS
jgi:hypothetical protein